MRLLTKTLLMMDAGEILGLAEELQKLGVSEFSAEGVHIKFRDPKPEHSEIFIPHPYPTDAHPRTNVTTTAPPADGYAQYVEDSFGGSVQ